MNGRLHQHTKLLHIYFKWVNYKACQLHLSKIFFRILNMNFHYIIAKFLLAAWGNILTMKISLERWGGSSWGCAQQACVRPCAQSPVPVKKKQSLECVLLRITKQHAHFPCVTYIELHAGKACVDLSSWWVGTDSSKQPWTLGTRTAMNFGHQEQRVREWLGPAHVLIGHNLFKRRRYFHFLWSLKTICRESVGGTPSFTICAARVSTGPQLLIVVLLKPWHRIKSIWNSQNGLHLKIKGIIFTS